MQTTSHRCPVSFSSGQPIKAGAGSSYGNDKSSKDACNLVPNPRIIQDNPQAHATIVGTGPISYLNNARMSFMCCSRISCLLKALWFWFILTSARACLRFWSSTILSSMLSAI